MHVNYQEYLESPEWDALRKEAYDRAGGLCELCGGKAEAVHHTHYPKSLKDDNLSRLVVVCEACHQKLHGITGEVAERLYYSKSIMNEREIGEEICPRCQSKNNHLYRIAFNVNGNITIIENGGARFLSGEPTGRGVSVWLHFACEENHHWAKRWQFHKGATYTALKKKPPIDFDPFRWSTLWRD